VVYGFDREEYGVRKPPSLKVASESYREEICEVVRLHDARGCEAEHGGPRRPRTRCMSRDMQKQRSSIGRFTVRPRT
jgi:hypothetical protein